MEESAKRICDHHKRINYHYYDGVMLYKCLDCSLVFRQVVDADRNPVLLYDDFYKNELSSRFNSWVEYIVRLLRLYRAFKIFTINWRAKTILDIGSGRGFTLHYLRKIFRYRRAAGIQISRQALDFSRNVLGLEIHDKDFLELTWDNNLFDVITLWHVLEHVVDPERYIEKTRDVLTADGCLIIEVPNFSSWTRKLAGKYWLGLDLTYHISFFSPESLVSMLERHGFRVTLVHTFSLEHSTFVSTQSIISRLTKTDQVFFRWLQGMKYHPRKLIINGMLILAIAPFCLIVNLFLFFSKRGEVLCLVAKRDNILKYDIDPSRE